MRLHFKQFSLISLRISRGWLGGWEGVVKPLASLPITFHLITIYERPRPPGTPRLYCIDPEISVVTFPTHPHLYIDGALCLFYPRDKTWLPIRDSIADLMYLAIQWLIAHLYWQRYGVWPWREAPHEQKTRSA